MKINGNELFVEDLGLKNNETIVFLNGVMTTTSSWYELSDWFVKNGYRVILHDFKGQLKSEKPDGPYTFTEHAEDTIEILRNLGIKKAHFIGTSYGGEVALKIGILFPEFVQTLSVIDSVSDSMKS
jgi:3-oxoadipate enol-lactonase